jgi:hypothetical protein
MISKIFNNDEIVLEKGAKSKFGTVEKIVPSKNGKHYSVITDGKEKILAIDVWGTLVEIKTKRISN